MRFQELQVRIVKSAYRTGRVIRVEIRVVAGGLVLPPDTHGLPFARVLLSALKFHPNFLPALNPVVELELPPRAGNLQASVSDDFVSEIREIFKVLFHVLLLDHEVVLGELSVPSHDLLDNQDSRILAEFQSLRDQTTNSIPAPGLLQPAGGLVAEGLDEPENSPHSEPAEALLYPDGGDRRPAYERPLDE